MAGPARGKATVDAEECKGCGLRVESCPPKCLQLTAELNSYGAHPAGYTGQDCAGCGICFYFHPEPASNYGLPHKSQGKAFAASQAQGGEHAATL